MTETEIVYLGAIASMVAALVAGAYAVEARRYMQKAKEQADYASYCYMEAKRYHDQMKADSNRASEEMRVFSKKITALSPFQVDDEAYERLREVKPHDQ